MWSNALCTLGVTKPICNCLSLRQVAAAAAAAAAANQGSTITSGPAVGNNAPPTATTVIVFCLMETRTDLRKLSYRFKKINNDCDQIYCDFPRLINLFIIYHWINLL